MSLSGRVVACGVAVLASAGIVTAVINSTGSTSVKSAGFSGSANHYYLEISGTGAGDPRGCNGRATTDYVGNYGFANQHLNGGIPVGVCYPATIGPFLGNGYKPDPAAPPLDYSVTVGVTNTLKALEEQYRKDPGARFTIVGFSQGAEVGDIALQKIAHGATGVPKSHIDGMLYGDPMQPGTGVWSNTFPKGFSVPFAGITSPGAGPAGFPGVPVKRFCIRTDGICDGPALRPDVSSAQATVQSIVGFFQQHGRYPLDGGVIVKTIANDGGNGIFWYPQGS